MSYEQIKQLKEKLGTTIKNLIALGDSNDPFYIGTPNHYKWANWLGSQWQNIGQCSHLRALHYQLISQAETVIMPDGEPYLNTNQCWKKLGNAMKWARYLGIVNPEALDDRRAPAPKIYFRPKEAWHSDHPSCYVDQEYQSTLESIDFSFPEWAPPTAIAYSEQDYEQAYHLEIWCEKSTMNSILEPLCRGYNMALQTGVGEISLTRCLELARRAKESGKPTRIFYISDFDPAGQSMPVAAARKIEWEIRELGEKPDIKLYPLALTLEQISRYNLPRTPIKETEKRANAFELRHGEGAVELDALEALHPGSLRRIIEEAIAPYIDIERANRRELQQINRANDEAIEEANRQALEPFEEDWAELEADVQSLKESLEADAKALIEGYQTRFEALCDRRSEIERPMEESLSELIPELTPELTTFEPKLLQDEPPALLDSKRSYLSQIRAYKRFQGKDEPDHQLKLDLGVDADFDVPT